MADQESLHFDIKKIERREWQLWALSLTLIFFLGSLTAGAYFLIVREYPQNSAITQAMAYRGLAGVCVLITLFCAYIIRTRVVLGRMRHLLAGQAMRDHLTGLLNR